MTQYLYYRSNLPAMVFLILSGYAITAVAGAYPEKNIEFIVGYAPGGGYSDVAQALAPFIEKHLPRKVNVVVRHMEGAGSAIAANYLQKAKPDGYTIGIYNLAGLAPTQLVRKVSYDLNEVTWLARLSVDNVVAVVNVESPYKSILDFKKQDKPMYLMSTRGLADNNTINAAVTFAKLGVKWKPLNHDGTVKAILAVMRGDADILWSTYESVRQYIESKDLRPILFYDTKRSLEFPDVPIPSELGMPDLDESMNSHRLLGAPPKLPPDVRAVLETAIRQAIEDRGFHEALHRMKRTAEYLNGRQAERVVRDSLRNFQAYTDVIKQLLGDANRN